MEVRRRSGNGGEAPLASPAGPDGFRDDPGKPRVLGRSPGQAPPRPKNKEIGGRGSGDQNPSQDRVAEGLFFFPLPEDLFLGEETAFLHAIHPGLEPRERLWARAFREFSQMRELRGGQGRGAGKAQERCQLQKKVVGFDVRWSEIEKAADLPVKKLPFPGLPGETGMVHGREEPVQGG